MIMTQRAKLRRWAFMPRVPSCPFRPAAAYWISLRPEMLSVNNARFSGLVHDPSLPQFKRRCASCQGNRPISYPMRPNEGLSPCGRSPVLEPSPDATLLAERELFRKDAPLSNEALARLCVARQPLPGVWLRPHLPKMH